MIQVDNSGNGDRVLLCCLFGDNLGETSRDVFENVVSDVFASQGLERFDGGVYSLEIGGRKTVGVVLRSGEWSRKTTMIVRSAETLLVGVCFHSEPEPRTVDATDLTDAISEGAEVGEERPSIPRLVCAALKERFPDGSEAASVFTVPRSATEFALEIE